jgi:hypothetical protein
MGSEELLRVPALLALHRFSYRLNSMVPKQDQPFIHRPVNHSRLFPRMGDVRPLLLVVH